MRYYLVCIYAVRLDKETSDLALDENGDGGWASHSGMEHLGCLAIPSS